MTLDEAIKHAEKVTEEKEDEGKLLCQSEGASIGCLTCAKEYKQPAEWLIDYKRLLDQEPCVDAISRREAIKKFTYNYRGKRIPDYDLENFPVQIDLITVREYLRDLPSVNPQKTGHWIIVDDCEKFIAKCSECGQIEDSKEIYRLLFQNHLK